MHKICHVKFAILDSFTHLCQAQGRAQEMKGGDEITFISMIYLFCFFCRELHMKLNNERKTKEKLEDRVVHNSESQGERKCQKAVAVNIYCNSKPLICVVHNFTKILR